MQKILSLQRVPKWAILDSNQYAPLEIGDNLAGVIHHALDVAATLAPGTGSISGAAREHDSLPYPDRPQR